MKLKSGEVIAIYKHTAITANQLRLLEEKTNFRLVRKRKKRSKLWWKKMKNRLGGNHVT